MNLKEIFREQYPDNGLEEFFLLQNLKTFL